MCIHCIFDFRKELNSFLVRCNLLSQKPSNTWCSDQPHFLEEAFCNVVQALVMHPFPSLCPSAGAFHYARTMCLTKLHRWTTDLWGFFADVRSQLERSPHCFATGLQMRKRWQRVVRRLLFFSFPCEWGGSGLETLAWSVVPVGPCVWQPGQRGACELVTCSTLIRWYQDWGCR